MLISNDLKISKMIAEMDFDYPSNDLPVTRYLAHRNGFFILCLFASTICWLLLSMHN